MPLEGWPIFLAETGESDNWLWALTVALALFLIFRLWPRTRPAVPSDPEGEADAALRIRRAADKALVELAEVGREISGRIDTKVRILNRLSKEAEAQIKRLEDLLRAAGREVPPLVGEDTTSATSSRRVAAVVDETDKAAKELHERVLQLSREGKTPAEIARLTRLAIQEIDLVLRLAAERSRNR
ncbi:MAG: hypothetical protein N3A66_07970 [Planctomycetota bacterium]|nr:hypothetical protein [Planctomycetota bacterium]